MKASSTGTAWPDWLLTCKTRPGTGRFLCRLKDLHKKRFQQKI